MSGYSAVAVDRAARPGLECPHCRHFLREAVQTEEGLRLCKSCFKQIQSLENNVCNDCGVSLFGEVHCYPDKAVQREVLAIEVFCKFADLGCSWKGKLKEWEPHCAECIFKGVPCPNKGCDATLPQKSLEMHQLRCPFRLVECQFCSTELPHNMLEEHFLKCDDFKVTCEEAQCGKQFSRKDMMKHKTQDCIVETCLTCDTKVFRNTKVEISASARIASTRGEPEQLWSQGAHSMSVNLPVNSNLSTSAQFPVHLGDAKVNFQHHQALAGDLRKLEREVESNAKTQEWVSKELKSSKESINQLKEENAKLKSEMQEVKSKVSGMDTAVVKFRQDISSREKPALDQTQLVKLSELVKSDAEKNNSIVRLKKDFSELHRTVEGIKNQSGGELMLVSRDGPGRGVERDTPRLRGVGSSGGGASESRLLSIEKRLEEMARQLTMVKVHGQELELQLQASLASTHNGSFLWRIPEVSRRRRDAVDERVTSIYSPPFYSGRNGYKMCIRAYLNGDGMGYKTHLSLFFVLMRGECDPLLKWPFEYKVSMILVDQTHRKHIVQTFKPTPESSSFQQPETDMNVASGCPQFAKLNIFNDESYVKNDVMFIKCIVDTTKIFHP